MKNYLIPALIILFYSFCAFTQEQEDVEQKARTDWEIYNNEIKPISMGLKTLKDITNEDQPLLNLEDFQLTSIERTGFNNSIRVCVFESNNIFWEIEYCGPAGTEGEGSWYNAMAGKIIFKDDPDEKSMYYYLESSGDRNVYFTPNSRTKLSIEARDVTLRNFFDLNLSFSFAGQTADMIKFAPVKMIQDVIQALRYTSHDLIEESFE